MFAAFVILWLLFGAAGAWRHLTHVADNDVAITDGVLALLMLLAGPLGLAAHLVLYRG